VHLPRSNFRRLYAFAIAAGLGLGIITYGLVRVIERSSGPGMAQAMLAALLVGLLIGLAFCVAIKLTLRQNAYDLYNYALDLTNASLPATSEAKDEINFMRQTLSQALATVPRAEDYPRITNDLMTARDFSAVLSITVTHLAERMPIQGAALLLLDTERHQLYTAASWGKIALSTTFTIDSRETAIGRALQEQRPLLYSGTQSSGLLPLGGGTEPPALFCLPLLANHQPLGVLCLAYHTDDLRLSEDQKIFARGASDMLTLALENLRHQLLFNRERERLDTFERLNTLLDATPQIEQALEHILRVAAKVTDSDHGTLLLLEADETRVRHRIALENGQTLPLSLVAPPVMKHGLAGWAIRERRADIIDDTERDARWLPVPGLVEIRSVMVVPLLYGSRVLAVLTLANPQPNHYSPRALGIVSGLTAYAVNLLARMELESLAQSDQHMLARQLFTGHLAPASVELLVADKAIVEQLTMPQTKPIVAVYCAVRGLDLLSTQIEPKILFEQVIAPFVQELSAVIYEHNGYLEQRDDGGILALFGYPQPADDDITRACRAALAIQACVRRLRSRWRQTLGRELNTGIGIANGVATLGISGPNQAQVYTVLSTAILQADRLQRLARKDEILLTPDVFAGGRAERAFHFEALEPLVQTDNERTQQVYRLLPGQ
jgi:GAF domain-containing protein